MSTINKIKEDLRHIYLGNIYTVETNLDLPQSGHTEVHLLGLQNMNT